MSLLSLFRSLCKNRHFQAIYLPSDHSEGKVSYQILSVVSRSPFTNKSATMSFMDSVTPPTVQSNPLFAPAAPPPKRGHKVLIGSLIALIVLVLIAGSATAAYRLGYLTLPFSSFFAPPLAPEE